MQTTMRGPFSGALIHQLERLFQHGTAIGLTEGQLLERFVGCNDEAAFEALIARHGPMVLGVCRQFLRDPNDVDDAFQATFLVLVRRAGTLRRRDLLGNWLYGVAHRVAMRSRAVAARRMARAPHGQDVVERLDAGHYGRNGDALSARDPEPGTWVHEEVRQLPEKYRTLVLLCYFEGLSHEEAAARLGCPIGTVKGRLARARDLLRRRLVRRGVTLSASAIAAHLAGADLRAAVPESLNYATIKAARAIATSTGAAIIAGTSVSLSVATLSQGVLRAMIMTQAKAIAIPLLIAGIITTGAVIGTAQQAWIDDPPLAHKQSRPPGDVSDKTDTPPRTVTEASTTATTPINQEPRTRPANELLAEELRGDQEMFDFMANDAHGLRPDSMQMLRRLSLRMLATGRDLSADHAARVAAYTAHRDRMKKLVDRAGRNETQSNSTGKTAKETEQAGSYVEEAEFLLDRGRKQESTTSSGGGKTEVAQASTASANQVADSAIESTSTANSAKAAETATGVTSTTSSEEPASGGAPEPTAEQLQAAKSRQRLYNRLEIAKLAGAVESRNSNPKNLNLLKKLDQPLELTMTRPTRLNDVLTHLRSILREADGKTIPIYVDAKGLEDAGVTLNTAVPMDLQGLPLKVALRVLLRRLGLAYCVRDGVLIISSIQGIREELAEAASELMGSEPNGLQGINLFWGGMGGGMGGMGGGMGGMGGGMGGGMR